MSENEAFKKKDDQAKKDSLHDEHAKRKTYATVSKWRGKRYPGWAEDYDSDEDDDWDDEER